MTDTSTALALAPRPGDLDTFGQADRAWPLAQRLAKSPEFVPKGMMNRPEAVLAVMLRAYELGIPPMVGLAQMHVVEGRVGLSAEMMRALVLRDGHELWPEELSNTRVTMCARRRGAGGDPVRVTWTLDDAKTAGLAGKSNWRAYPRAMLTARATAELARLVFPDVVGGLQALEELWDIVDTDGWETTDAPERPAGAVPATTRKAAAPTARPRKKAAPRASATSVDGPPQPPLPHELDNDASPAASDSEISQISQVTNRESGAPEAAVDPEVTARAQKIAMRCNDLGLDRAEVIYAATGGQKTSARALTVDEAVAVLEALRRIKDGTKRLDTTGDEPELVDADPPNPDDVVVEDWSSTFGSEHTWDADTWRRFLSEHGVKVVAALREAQKLAAEMDEQPPGNLDGLHGRVSLASLVRGFVEDQVAQAGGS